MVSMASIVWAGAADQVEHSGALFGRDAARVSSSRRGSERVRGQARARRTREAQSGLLSLRTPAKASVFIYLLCDGKLPSGAVEPCADRPSVVGGVMEASSMA